MTPLYIVSSPYFHGYLKFRVNKTELNLISFSQHLFFFLNYPLFFGGGGMGPSIDLDSQAQNRISIILILLSLLLSPTLCLFSYFSLITHIQSTVNPPINIESLPKEMLNLLLLFFNFIATILI